MVQNTEKNDKSIIDDEVDRLLKISARHNKIKHPIMSKIFSRLFVMALLTIIQLVFLYGLVGWFDRSYSGYAFIINDVFGFVCIIWVLNTKTSANYKQAWIVLMAIFPLMGLLFYLYTRLNPLEKKRFEMLRVNIEQTRDLIRTEDRVKEKRASESGFFRKLTDYTDGIGHFPTFDNSEIKYYSIGKRNKTHKNDDDILLKDIKKEIMNAKKFIFLEFFIVDRGIMWSDILGLLIQRAREGVEVRIMYDDMGSISTLSQEYRKEYERVCGLINAENDKNGNIVTSPWAPINFFFSTIYNNRDHRKILVIDGTTAFSGGFNIGDEYINEKERFGIWKDNAFRIKGSAVQSYTLMFIQMWNVYEATESYADFDGIRKIGADRKNKYGRNLGWYLTEPFAGSESDEIGGNEIDNNDNNKESQENKGYIIPYGDGPHVLDNIAENVYIDAINAAQKSVYIMTPYLIPDNEILHAIKHAKKSGIDVKVIIPGIPDKKVVYKLTEEFARELVNSGVEIYKYTDGFVHTKLVLVDNIIAATGTVNLDYRSLYLHFECGSVIYNDSVIDDIIKDFNDTLKDCRLVNGEKYPLLNRLVNPLLRIFAPLL